MLRKPEVARFIARSAGGSSRMEESCVLLFQAAWRVQRARNWVAVKELDLSYCIGETNMEI